MLFVRLFISVQYGFQVQYHTGWVSACTTVSNNCSFQIQYQTCKVFMGAHSLFSLVDPILFPSAVSGRPGKCKTIMYTVALMVCCSQCSFLELYQACGVSGCASALSMF